MVPDDDTLRLAHQAHNLEDTIAQRRALWADAGGRSVRDRYLRPHADSVAELVASLRRRDVALAEMRTALTTVHRNLADALSASAAARAELADVRSAVACADREIAEASVAKASADAWADRAVALAKLANSCPGTCCSDESPADKHERTAILSGLDEAFPTLGVRHLLEGESNSKGRFAGFHSRRSKTGFLLSAGEPDAAGVYSASVVGWHPDGHVVFKTVAKHTMFPDHWSEERICEEVLGAYRKTIAAGEKSQRWQETGRSGVSISGYVRDDGFIIGYPVQEVGP